MKTEVDERLQAALRDLGYARVKKNVYRAPWGSTTISHFIYLRWFHNFGTDEEVEVDIGLCRHEAQTFAMAMWYDFGNPFTRDLWKLGPTDSVVSFSLGKLCSWSLMWRLCLDGQGTDACVQKITGDLEQTLRPLVGKTRDDATLYAFLTQTENKSIWPANGAVRAAEAIFLGKRLGYPHRRVMSEIEPFRLSIAGQVDRAKKIDDYLAQAWARA